MVTVDSNEVFTAGSVRDGIHVGNPVYVNDVGWITTKRPDDLASIIGRVEETSNDGRHVMLTIEPGVAIAYNIVISHNGGMITEGEYFDPHKTIGYGDEGRLSEKQKTIEKVASKREGGKRKDGMRKGGATKTTIDEDLMNALLED